MMMILSTLFAAAAAVAAPAAAPDPNAREVERVFMKNIGHFNNHELEPFLAGFDPNLRMYAVSEWLRGEDQVRARFVQTFRDFPKVRMEITNLKARSETPDVVTVEFEFHTYPHGHGGAFHGVGSGVYRKKDGRWREVLEHESVTRRDASLAPPPARR